MGCGGSGGGPSAPLLPGCKGPCPELIAARAVLQGAFGSPMSLNRRCTFPPARPPRRQRALEKRLQREQQRIRRMEREEEAKEGAPAKKGKGTKEVRGRPFFSTLI